MSAEILRRTASLMRERAEACLSADDQWYEPDEMLGMLRSVDSDSNAQPYDAQHIASWHPAVALAVAKAMDDVAHAWEIADESADGWVYDADDNHYRFDETVDGGWLNVARAYLGEST